MSDISFRSIRTFAPTHSLPLSTMNPSVRFALLRRPSVVLVLISVLILPAVFLYPFHSDVDIYQAMGLQVYRAGGLPFLQSFVANFPGPVLLHVLAICLFGNTVAGFRALELIVLVLTLFALYRVSRFWLSQASSLLGCYLFAIVYVFGPGQLVGQPDGFAVLPLVLALGSIIAAYRAPVRSHTIAWALSAGVFYAAATCLRPTYALMLVPSFLFLTSPRVGRTICAFTVIGFALAASLIALPLALQPNGLQEAYLESVRYNLDVYSHIFLADYSRRVWIVVAFIAGWALMVGIHRKTSRNFAEAPASIAERRFLIASFAALALEIASVRRYTGYHFVPFFSLFMPVIAALVWEWRLRLGNMGTVLLSLALLVLTLEFYPWKLLVPIVKGQSSARPFSEAWYEDPETRDADAYLMRHTHPWDAVEVAAFSPALRWRIDRPSATRFTTPSSLTTTKPDGTFTNYQRVWQAEYIGQLQRVRPKYYVVNNLI